MKARAKGAAEKVNVPLDGAKAQKVIFACDAGMGSSAMGATKFRNRIKAEHLDLLGNICNILEDEDALKKMKTTGDVDYLLSQLQ